MRTPYLGSFGVVCCAFFLVCPVHSVAQSNSAVLRDSQSSAQSGPAENTRDVAANLSLTASRELPDSPGSTLLQLQSSEGGQQQEGTAPSPSAAGTQQDV